MALGRWYGTLFILKLNGTERLLLSSGIHLVWMIISAKLYTSDSCQVRITEGGKKVSYIILIESPPIRRSQEASL